MTFLQEIEGFLLSLQKHYGFVIPVDRLRQCLMCADSITDVKEVYYRLQSLVCTSQEQIDVFRSVFAERFLKVKPKQDVPALSAKDIDNAKRAISLEEQRNTKSKKKLLEQQRKLIELAEKEDELHRILEASEAERLALSNEGKRFIDAKEQAESAARPNLESSGILNKLAKIQELYQEISSLISSGHEDFFKENELSFDKIKSALDSPDFASKIEALSEKTLALSAKYRNNKDFDMFSLLLKTIEPLNCLKSEAGKSIKAKDKKGLKEARKKNSEFEEKLKALDDKSNQLNESIRELHNERASLLTTSEKLEKGIQGSEKRIASLQMQVDTGFPVVKEQAITHRPEFLSGIKAVKTTKEIEDLLKTDLKRMSSAEKDKICSYIRSSARAFRQTLRRTSASIKKKKIDVKRTIRIAARTNGEPIKVVYKQPKKSHAKVIILTDISGSCRKASSLALYFMALMESAFPGGCRKFVFVNKLVNVDRCFRDKGPEDGVQDVLDTVPTRGIYSDYGTVISQLKDEYGGIIHKDTTVIILGDARNNKNEANADKLKFIADRCHKLFWLNPDDPGEWNHGDSIIDVYTEAGAETHSVQTAGDLIRFLQNIKAKS